MKKPLYLNIRNKLSLLIGILIFALVLQGALSFYLLETIKIKGPYYEKIINQKDFIADILPPPAYVIEYYLLANIEMNENDPDKLESLIKRSNKLEKDYAESHERWAKMLPEGKLKDLFVRQSDTFVQEIFSIWNKNFIVALQQGKKEEAAAALKKISKKYELHRAMIDEVVRLETIEGTQLEEEVARIYKRNQFFATLAWVSTVLIGIVLAYIISRSIYKSLKNVVGGLSLIFNEISARTDLQAKAVGQQSSSTHQTTSTMDELNTSFQHTEGLAQESSDRAKSVLQIAEKGNEMLKIMITNLSTHREKVSNIVEQILHLSGLIRQIHNISSVTSNLTNQTNILALNAAVQAAHVKQGGEGFSVIANEIRKLADESKKFLSHIDVLVESIQQASDATVAIAEEGNKTVQGIIQQTQETANAFDTLIAITNKSFEGAEQTSLNIKQQGIAVHQVLDAMENLNEATQQTLTGVQQVRDELNKLNVITLDIKQII